MSLRYSTQPEFAPLRSNPLSWWLRLGAALLHGSLWARDHRHNPLMIAFTGRSRRLFLVDSLAWLPALGLAAGNGFFLFRIMPGALHLEAYVMLLMIELIAVIPVSGVATAVFVAFSGRGLMRHLPMEEIMLTRLTPEQIVHGLAIRPLAAVSACVFFGFIFQILLLAAYMIETGWRSDLLPVLGLCALVLAAGWYLCDMVVDLCGATSIRANLYIRSPILAVIRSLSDLATARLPILAVVLVFGCFVCLGARMNCLVVLIMIPLLLIVSSGDRVIARGIEALKDAAWRPDLWWISADPPPDLKGRLWLRLSWEKLIVLLAELSDGGRYPFGKTGSHLVPRNSRRR